MQNTRLARDSNSWHVPSRQTRSLNASADYRPAPPPSQSTTLYETSRIPVSAHLQSKALRPLRARSQPSFLVSGYHRCRRLRWAGFTCGNVWRSGFIKRGLVIWVLILICRPFGRPKGGFAEWVDRHGCRESCDRAKDGPSQRAHGAGPE